ncbi:hypothetical protein COCOBI_pt-2250 (chloroplast) [Coccomyxa sp. Obi]|nr:hypothetical protein COCOBI_pt-2250 [Coccomyxa sp. Obi]
MGSLAAGPTELEAAVLHGLREGSLPLFDGLCGHQGPKGHQDHKGPKGHQDHKGPKGHKTPKGHQRGKNPFLSLSSSLIDEESD